MASPTREISELAGPLVRPVAQVLISITDTDAYDRAIAESVAWLRKRSGVRLPRSAFEGLPFTTADIPQANRVEAVATTIDSHNVWAARLEYPDTDVAQRTWITEIVVSEYKSIVRSSIRLINVTRRLDPPFKLTTPRLSYQFLSKLSCEIDGYAVSEAPWRVEADEAERFLELLRSESRASPIVVVTESDARDAKLVGAKLISRVGGAAHIAILSSEMCWILTNSLGKRQSVFGGALRIYRPGFGGANDSYLRHPLWLNQLWSDADEILDDVASEILPLSFLSSETTDRIRFEDVREAYREGQRARHQVGTVGNNDQKANSDILELQTEIAQMREASAQDRAAQDQLLSDAADRQNSAEIERDSALAEAAKLRSRIRSLEIAVKTGRAELDEDLSSMADFDIWAERHLSGRMYIFQKAIRETKKYGFSDPVLFGRMLIAIRDNYVGMRRGELSKLECDNALRSLGIEEGECFEEKGSIKDFPEYRITYKGRNEWMFRHFKYGSKFDQRRMFRIYYIWDEDEEILVIGHMPSHLDNLLTN